MAEINQKDNLNQGIPSKTGLDDTARAALQRSLNGKDGGIKVGSFRDLQLGLTNVPIEDRPTPETQSDENLVTVLEHDIATGADTELTRAAGVSPSTSGGEDWSEYTVEELKDELAERGHPVSGTKDELIARLEGK